jgi:1-hydroxycarotenoid 3,4-desaturase
MPWVFEALFADAGLRRADFLTWRPLDPIARHFWPGGATLDLFREEPRTRASIAVQFGEAEAEGYSRFAAKAEDTWRTLEHAFVDAPQPDVATVLSRAGLRGLASLSRLDAFRSMQASLTDTFASPRLRRLFGRYATYFGSLPQEAPAVLHLVSHVERIDVVAVEGGMTRLAQGLAAGALRLGAEIRGSCEVAAIDAGPRGVRGIRLASGEPIAAEVVIANVEPAALTSGLLGDSVRGAIPPRPVLRRSLSATTCAATARIQGPELAYHNVFFPPDESSEYVELAAGVPPRQPAVYVCAQDRAYGPPPPGTLERLLFLVNSPPSRSTPKEDDDPWNTIMLPRLEECGIRVEATNVVRTTPEDFAARFPASQGALYGNALRGPLEAFQRQGARTRIPGLYLAGGNVHPGPGLPMVALSGRNAVLSWVQDSGGRPRSRAAATRGGTWTPWTRPVSVP